MTSSSDLPPCTTKVLMSSAIELLPYGVAADISEFLPIIDISSLRAASTYFMWTVDGFYESQMKTLARKFDIEHYKSDAEVETEIRRLLFGYLRLKEKFGLSDLNFYDMYELFEWIQRKSPQDLHLPHLTLKILRMRDTLTFKEGKGFMRKILKRPRLYKECLKHLTRHVFKIHRIDLRATLYYELGIRSMLLRPLLYYQLTCIAKSHVMSALLFYPKVLLLLLVMMKIAEEIHGNLSDVRNHVYLFTFVYLALCSVRYRNLSRERLDSFIDS